MIQDGLEITYQSFKEKWIGADEKSHMLLQVFKLLSCQSEIVG
jgi:hypothetical protein